MAQMPPRKKARLTVTMEDGREIVYHTNRRDALHQLLLGAGALSTDRCGRLGERVSCCVVVIADRLPNCLAFR